VEFSTSFQIAPLLVITDADVLGGSLRLLRSRRSTQVIAWATGKEKNRVSVNDCHGKVLVRFNPGDSVNDCHGKVLVRFDPETQLLSLPVAQATLHSQKAGFFSLPGAQATFTKQDADHSQTLHVGGSCTLNNP